MPHDKMGSVVEVGQQVTVRFKVLSVSQNVDYCNCHIEVIEPMYPGSQKVTLNLNTRQVEVLKQADWRLKLDKEAILHD